MSAPEPLQRMIDRLRTRAHLQPDDCDAIRALPTRRRSYEPPAYLVREGRSPIQYCSFLISGFAIRQKLAANGARQIVSIHVPGDYIDLQNLFLKRADHNVQALTRLETIDIERQALQDLVLRHPPIGRALWIDALVDASIYREWVLNVGRRDARQRIAHLLCEFTVRMEAVGLAERGTMYELPMTQEQLGDATGLTSVHVNRTLKALEGDGLISRNKRFITIADWDRMRAVADFSALYLHLDQTHA
ncbi:MAG: Crp/Fnr family transcriptional regulator [Sphingomonas sp.]